MPSRINLWSILLALDSFTWPTREKNHNTWDVKYVILQLSRKQAFANYHSNLGRYIDNNKITSIDMTGIRIEIW